MSQRWTTKRSATRDRFFPAEPHHPIPTIRYWGHFVLILRRGARVAIGEAPQTANGERRLFDRGRVRRLV